MNTAHRLQREQDEPGRAYRDESGAALRRAVLRASRAELLAHRQAGLLALLAELLDEPTLQRALDGFAGALHQRFSARRVAVALTDDRGELRLGALSQRTLVETGSADVQRLLAAMEEAADQDRTVQFPTRQAQPHEHPRAPPGSLAAHRALLAEHAGGGVVSVPMCHDARLVGALLIERGGAEAFSPRTLAWLEHVALAAAPLLAVRREAERGAFARLGRDIGQAVERRLGVHRLGVPALLAAGVAALLLGLLVPVERHVRAVAELVPHERRLVTAPVGGFVDEVLVGAGERVEPGQLLARLDGRELALEAAREDSEVLTARADLRAAMASHDRQASAVARARLEQQRAERALIEHRIARGELRAPIAGLITSGDPRDAIGAPIGRGDTLLEIVPGDDYEVHLLVDAADIRDIAEAQTGALELEARPGERLAIVVRSIHPVAENVDGANRFRVKAALSEKPEGALRPGESGLARLEVGRTSALGRLVRPLAQRLAELRWRLLG